MKLKDIHIQGYKSFVQEIELTFLSAITGIVGPNGSGKSNVTEAFRFVLGEQSMKTLRAQRGEDLIFNGGNGLSTAPYASVSISFDNTDRAFEKLFDTVTITRKVHRDGSNVYLINDTEVKIRDVIELLAQVNIGATGHHIISQGEADRILNAKPEERKEMIEDGLGLKLFQYRKQESEKKLNKAKDHMEEVLALEREIAPQLKYLKKQVEKRERVDVLRKELEAVYSVYQANESHYIKREKELLTKRIASITYEIGQLDSAIEKEKQKMSDHTLVDSFKKESETLRSSLFDIRTRKDALTREITRIEVLKETEERMRMRQETESLVPFSLFSQAIDSLAKEITIAQTVESCKSLVESFISTVTKLTGTQKQNNIQDETYNEEKYKQLSAERENLEKNEARVIHEQLLLEQEQGSTILKAQDMEQGVLHLVTQKNTFEQKKSDALREMDRIIEDEVQFNQDNIEILALLPRFVFQQNENTHQNSNENIATRELQKETRRSIERLKIHIEELGTETSPEVFDEYTRLTERTIYLEKERNDITTSITSLEETIQTLQEHIHTQFSIGIKKINTEFEQFFKTLFGGGKAYIDILKIPTYKKIETPDGEVEQVIDPSEPMRYGVTIHISLPHKKVSTLDQLSGGERALISIALLFAISQVTPPPFLILDETDAALDEANSRRYGDMIEELAKKSQLILVTHNRETMYRAGTLYGVTMGKTGASTLLSINFEDAVKVAK
ncbi:MAG: AAA family ATPase [Alphaproteobacteria bacterium]|nr:AAA family ATPase [Alphaproteobacteria bacterium]